MELISGGFNGFRNITLRNGKNSSAGTILDTQRGHFKHLF